MTAKRYYRLGDTGPVVAEIRTKLAMLGLLPVEVATADGTAMDRAVLDAETDRAVLSLP